MPVRLTTVAPEYVVSPRPQLGAWLPFCANSPETGAESSILGGQRSVGDDSHVGLIPDLCHPDRHGKYYGLSSSITDDGCSRRLPIPGQHPSRFAEYPPPTY
jgi:hypothetical protein